MIFQANSTGFESQNELLVLYVCYHECNLCFLSVHMRKPRHNLVLHKWRTQSWNDNLIRNKIFTLNFLFLTTRTYIRFIDIIIMTKLNTNNLSQILLFNKPLINSRIKINDFWYACQLKERYLWGKNEKQLNLNIHKWI